VRKRRASFSRGHNDTVPRYPMHMDGSAVALDGVRGEDQWDERKEGGVWGQRTDIGALSYTETNQRVHLKVPPGSIYFCEEENKLGGGQKRNRELRERMGYIGCSGEGGPFTTTTFLGP